MRFFSELLLPLRSLHRMFLLAAPLAVLLAIGAAAFFGLLTVEQETPEPSEATHVSQVPEIFKPTPAPPGFIEKHYQSATLPPLRPALADLPPLARKKPGVFGVIALPKSFDAFAVNNKGEVGGMSGKKAAIWVRGRMRVWENEAYLNPDNPHVSLAITDLSDASVLGGMHREIGEGAGGSVYYSEVSFWHRSKTKADTAGPLPNLSGGSLYGLNAQGQAVGVYSPNYTTESRDGGLPEGISFEYTNGFYWDGKVTRDLGRGAAFGINERNQVVGAQKGKIVLWQGSEKQELGKGIGYAINNRGDILANPSASADYLKADLFDPSKRSFAQLPQASLLHNNTQTRLGILPDCKSGFAKSLNDRNEIVGFCSPDVGDRQEFDGGDEDQDLEYARTFKRAFARRRAFLWRAGKLYDLNALLSKHSGWVLHDARSINNKGQIVGRGTFHGKKRSFLLTPR